MKPQNTPNTRKEFLYEKESYAIRGAVFDVYREMGCGFLEAVYQECLEKELKLRGIPFVAQQALKPESNDRKNCKIKSPITKTRYFIFFCIFCVFHG